MRRSPQHVPREVILRIARRDDVAPRGSTRGHADEGIGGARRRSGGGRGDGEVDPPQLVRAGYGNLSANYSPGGGGGHGCLVVGVVGYAGGRRGKEGFCLFGESGFWAARWSVVGGSDQGHRALRTSRCRDGPFLYVFFSYIWASLFFPEFWPLQSNFLCNCRCTSLFILLILNSKLYLLLES